MKKVIAVLLLSTCFIACKRKKEDIILKHWQGVAFENPDMDSMIREQEHFIDTVGKSTDAVANKAAYGTDNIDSFKRDLQTQLDSFKVMQMAAVTGTEFDFRKGGKAIVNFGNGYIDSCKWYFDDEGALMLDELKMKGAGDKIKMDVIMLTDTMMKLRLNEEGSKSTVTFKPKKS